MIRKVKLLLGVALLAGLSTQALAEGPGWTSNRTITSLVVTFDGGVNIRLSPELSNCVSQSGYGPAFASIYPAHPGIKQMKADLLVAYVTGKPVALYFMDATCKVGETILGGW